MHLVLTMGPKLHWNEERDILAAARADRYIFECRECLASQEQEEEEPEGEPETVPEDIEPAPAKQTRRGKWRRPNEEARESKRRKKKDKRRKDAAPKPPKSTTIIVTWNLQGISASDRNRGRLRRAAEYARQRKWEMVLVSERRAAQAGVIWLGEGEEQVAIVHSERCGISS